MNESEIIRKALVEWEADNYPSINSKEQRIINGLVRKYKENRNQIIHKHSKLRSILIDYECEDL